MPKSEEKRKPRPGKKKKNESLELLRAITRSMAGAIPGISDETRDTIEDSMARPLSGLASQVLAEDPNEPGKLVFPPWHNIKRQLGADKRRKAGLPREKMAMPGLIQDTLSLPAMFGGGPEWAQNASESANLIHSAVDEGMNLAPPQGFRQNALNSLGMMGAQIPIAGKAKEVADIGKGALHIAKKYGKQALMSPVEFLSPTIEPKMSNYLFGAGAGGALGSLGDESAEVVEEIPQPRVISRAKGGKIDGIKELLKMISINPDARVKQTAHQMGDPVEEVLYATNEGQRRGVLSGDEATRIKELLSMGEEEELSEALIDLHSRLNPPAQGPTTMQKLPPWIELVYQDKAYREPVHGKGILSDEEFRRIIEASGKALGGIMRKSKGGMIQKLVNQISKPEDMGDDQWARIRNRMKDWNVQSVDDLELIRQAHTPEQLKLEVPRLDDGTDVNKSPRSRTKLDILKNPKSQDDVVRWAGREVPEIRFMTDQDGNTYIWDASKAIHRQVLEALGLGRKGLFHEMSDTPIPPELFDEYYFSNPWE